jgi:hypothetical protein
MLGDVDKGLGDSGWQELPGTVLVVGEKDVVAQTELNIELAAVIGKPLFPLFDCRRFRDLRKRGQLLADLQ